MTLNTAGILLLLDFFLQDFYLSPFFPLIKFVLLGTIGRCSMIQFNNLSAFTLTLWMFSKWTWILCFLKNDKMEKYLPRSIYQKNIYLGQYVKKNLYLKKSFTLIFYMMLILACSKTKCKLKEEINFIVEKSFIWGFAPNIIDD